MRENQLRFAVLSKYKVMASHATQENRVNIGPIMKQEMRQCGSGQIYRFSQGLFPSHVQLEKLPPTL